MDKAGKTAALIIGLLMASVLFGCTNNDETISTCNVLDEMLTCDLGDFSDEIGGTQLSDWRKFGSGGDGIKVSTAENDMDVNYSFTIESSASSDRLDRLECMKTITATQIPNMVLNIRISEGYNSSNKTIGRRTISYFVTENPANLDAADVAGEPSTCIDEDEAIELMEENGCLQLVQQLETSPIEFFVNAYIEHEDTQYSSDNWGDFENGATKNNSEIHK